MSETCYSAIPKSFLSADQLTRDSFSLGRVVWDSGYRPDVLLALWRGGTPVGIAVHEYLKFKGLDCYHTAIKSSSYTAIGESVTPELESFERVFRRLPAGGRVLVVDDIFDTGKTAQRVYEEFADVNCSLKFAVLYYKPLRNVTSLKPDYHIHETDRWLVFPHEIEGLSPEEIMAKDPDLYNLLFDC